MSGISRSQVSRLCDEIDGWAQTFLTRPLDGDWPGVWLNGIAVMARQLREVAAR